MPRPVSRLTLVLSALLLLGNARPGASIHRPGRGLRADVVGVRAADDVIVVLDAAGVAVPRRLAGGHARAPPRGLDLAPDRRRPRRPGSGADRSVHAEGMLPNFSALAAERQLPAARHHVPVGVAGGVVVVQHGHEPGAPQHLRFPRSRSAHLPADAVVGADRQGRSVPEARPLPHSAAQAGAAAAARVEAVLDDPRRARIWSTVLRVPITFPPDRFYGAELSAMCVPGSARHAGHVPALHTRARGTRVQGRRHARATCRVQSTIASSRRVAGPGQHASSRGAAARRCRCACSSIAPRRRADVEIGDTRVTLTPAS